MTPQQLKDEARKELKPFQEKILGIDAYNWGQDKFMEELEAFIDSLLDKAYEDGKKEGWSDCKAKLITPTKLQARSEAIEETLELLNSYGVVPPNITALNQEIRNLK